MQCVVFPETKKNVSKHIHVCYKYIRRWQNCLKYRLSQNITVIHFIICYFGNTVHIKIVQIMHRSCKLILKKR